MDSEIGKLLCYLFLSTALFTLTVRGSIDVSSENTLDYDQLKSMLDKKDIQLFDCREPREIKKSGSIPGAINIPLGKVEAAFAMSDQDFKQKYGIAKPNVNDDNIVFSCRSGRRSATALETIFKQGYTRAKHFGGGWLGWAERQKDDL